MEARGSLATQSAPIAFGPYRVVNKIGQGGMGLVYEAVHVASGAHVAVKTVRAVKSRALAGLRAEILALKEIHHPGVVRILDEGLKEGLPWYAMELLTGKTLARLNQETWGAKLGILPETVSTLLASDPTVGSPSRTQDAFLDAYPDIDSLPVLEGAALKSVLHLYFRLCQPLGHIHGRGLIHRDLKPTNVFVRPDGLPVLMDFGLVSRTASGLEIGARILGSAPYVSPEAIRGGYVDGRADLYSLGCMLYESLTGRLPFSGDSPAEIVEKHLNDAADPPSRRARGIPRALDDLVLRLLAKRPRDRIGYADELAAALGALGAEEFGKEAASGLAAHHPYRPEMVGREAVIEDLRAARRRAERGEGSITLVGGESGIGKTFLAEEVGRLALRERFFVVRGACTPVTTRPAGHDLRAGPLHPFRPFLQGVADRCREGGDAATERILGPRVALLRHYEPALAALPGAADVPELPVLPPEAAKRRLFELLAETLRRFSDENPTLLVLDDVQWADELSLEFLEYFAAGPLRDQRLLVLATYRSEETEGPIENLAALPGVRAIQLRRLSDRDVSLIAAEMLATAAPPEPIVRFLAARSEGNPFFAAEYLRFAAAEGLVTRTNGTWVMSSSALAEAGLLENLDLPISVKELIERRLKTIAVGERTLVEAAAVLGSSWDGEVAAIVAGTTDAGAERSLKRLQIAHVVEPIGDGKYRFTHDRLRETIYGQIDDRHKKALHLSAVRALETRYSEDEISQHLRELAFHHQVAGQPAEALTYLERAAEQALAKFANVQAVALLKVLLEMVDGARIAVDANRRAGWERRLGDAYHGLGLMAEAEAHLANAVDLLGWPVPRTKARGGITILGQLLQQTSRRLFATHPERAPGEKQRFLEGARAYDRLLQVYYYTGNPVAMFVATLRTLNLAESAGPSPELAAAYSIAHAVAGIMPARGLAELYIGLAGRVLKEVPDAATESYLQLLEGVYRCGVGEWDRARAALEAGRRNADELGFHRRSAEINLGLAYWYFFKGDLDAALVHADAIETEGDAQAKLWRMLMRATIALQGDQTTDDAATLLDAVASAETAGRAEKIWFFALGAYISFSRHRDGDAQTFLARALEAIEAGTPVNLYCVDAYNRAAAVAIGLLERQLPSPTQETATAQVVAGRACRALRSFARVFPVSGPRAWRQEARLAAATGNQPRALRLWARSVADARRLALPLDEALGASALARQLDPADPERLVRPLLAPKATVDDGGRVA